MCGDPLLIMISNLVVADGRMLKQLFLPESMRAPDGENQWQDEGGRGRSAARCPLAVRPICAYSGSLHLRKEGHGVSDRNGNGYTEIGKDPFDLMNATRKRAPLQVMTGPVLPDVTGGGDHGVLPLICLKLACGKCRFSTL